MTAPCPRCGAPASYVGAARAEDDGPGCQEVYECAREGCPTGRFKE